MWRRFWELGAEEDSAMVILAERLWTMVERMAMDWEMESAMVGEALWRLVLLLPF